MTSEAQNAPVSTPSGPSAGLEGEDATQETQDATEAAQRRRERYAEGISSRLHVTTDNWSYQQFRPALSADTSSVLEAAKGAIAVADAEHHQRLAEIDAVVQTEWRARAEAAGDRVAALEATVREALSTFAHPTHPGRECRQSGHVPVETLRRWQATLDAPKDTTAP